jgi:hypothetical protein
MARENGDAGYLIRRHVRRVLEKLTGRQRQSPQSGKPVPDGSGGVSAEVDAEENRTAPIRDGKDPA